jgi:hypothetical protein
MRDAGRQAICKERFWLIYPGCLVFDVRGLLGTYLLNHPAGENNL